MAEPDRLAVAALAVGSIVLFLSHSPTVLPFASVFLRSLRGDEILVETRLLNAPREWKRLVKVADLVLSDALSTAAARAAGARRLREIRVVQPSSLERLRDALTIVVPRADGRGEARVDHPVAGARRRAPPALLRVARRRVARASCPGE